MSFDQKALDAERHMRSFHQLERTKRRPGARVEEVADDFGDKSLWCREDLEDPVVSIEGLVLRKVRFCSGSCALSWLAERYDVGEKDERPHMRERELPDLGPDFVPERPHPRKLGLPEEPVPSKGKNRDHPHDEHPKDEAVSSAAFT